MSEKRWVMPWKRRKPRPLVKGNEDDKFIWMPDAIKAYKECVKNLDRHQARLLRTRAQLRTATRNNDQDNSIRVLNFDVTRALEDIKWAIPTKTTPSSDT